MRLFLVAALVSVSAATLVGCNTAPDAPGEGAAAGRGGTAQVRRRPGRRWEDLKYLPDAIRPLGWTVNDLREDADPYLVRAAFVRSRYDKKTEVDFAAPVPVLAETGVPVILDFGYVGTPATDAWVPHFAGARLRPGSGVPAGSRRRRSRSPK